MGPVLNGCSEAKTNEKLAIVKSLKESLAHSKCSSSDWKIRPFHLNTGDFSEYFSQMVVMGSNDGTCCGHFFWLFVGVHAARNPTLVLLGVEFSFPMVWVGLLSLSFHGSPWQLNGEASDLASTDRTLPSRS